MKRFFIAAILSAFFFQGSALASDFTLQARQDSTFNGFQLRYGGFLKWCGPEKLYLHLDRTYYASGETIWFAAYLKNATGFAQDVESNFIYVELMNEKTDICARVKIKRKTGFHGRIEIQPNLPSGKYVVRAYTLWQLNSSPEYMFHQQIRIYNPAGKKTASDVDETDAAGLDLTFYPEGGRYFNGFRSRIAFKVMNSKGKSLELIAALTDDLGKTILWTATVHDGMGAFSFIPESGRKYFLKTKDGLEFKLPDPSEEGATLSVYQDEESVKVIPISAGSGKYTIAYRCIDDLKFIGNIEFEAGQHKINAYSLGIRNFHPGINHFLLIDSHGRIASERMFFIDNPNRVNCDIKFVSGAKDRRSLTRVEVSLSDTTKAYASISVVRGAFKNFRQNDDIVSYMMLSSELEGSINNPSEYFDVSISKAARQRYLDLLMMVQGWRYYELDYLARKPAVMGKYRKEYTQSVKGHITRSHGAKIPKNFIFSVIIPKLKFTYFKDVEEGSDFEITELDFRENTDFFIKAQRPGLYFDYLPKWDGDVFAPPYRYAAPSGTATLEAASAFAYDVSADTLSSAVVTASQDSPFSRPVDGRDISNDDLVRNAHMNLIAYLSMRVPAFEYNGEFMRNRRFFTMSHSYKTDAEDETITPKESEEFFGVSGEVKLIVNELEEQWIMYDQLRLSEIESVSYSTTPDLVFNSPGGAVYVKLKTGAKHVNVSMDESVLYFVPLGWQVPSKFYSPRYDKGDKVPGDDGFDHRNTVHWRGVRGISKGRCNEYFCTTDQNDFPYLVVVQGMNMNGEAFTCSKLIFE